jgi:tetratricopeptide (TPR) repeat protein
MARMGARLGLTRYEADEYYRLALNHYQKKNLEEAINNINLALELFPNRAEYFATRGLFRLEDGLPEQAEADFDAALQRHPYDMLANYGKAAVLYGRGEYEAALEYFTKAWAAQPERVETLYYLAMTEHRLKHNQKALRWMQQASDKLSQQDITDRETRKRQRNAERWIREFEKLLREEGRDRFTINPPAPPN